ncbi:MAG: adenylate/guanylate cyclase domain-containing protein [Candidatus Tectomicrobia bacterium]|uniref:Adenylate/guanylate cyclase domain-containing protein n=1 Tax=Tectimicrobiota bacterium TaxID=2528274 RepID=A0A932CQN4_UNCTE|nr:adenylate/guanylate cyclase domain-containing protein [Candidatus Tectomicrobia bacterium]
MSRLRKTAIVGLLTGLCGLGLAPVVHRWEEAIGLDFLFTRRGVRAVPPGVVIVALDKVSANRLNLPKSPERWPRSLHARLIERLSQQGTRVIAFDITFDEARSPHEDRLLAQSIHRARRIILCEYIDKETVPLKDERGVLLGDLNLEKVIPPILPLARSALAQAPFPLPKVPVQVSQYWTFKTSAGDTPTLPVVTFQAFGLEVYDELIRQLRRISPALAARLPRDRDAVMAARNVRQLTQALRGIFQKHPWVAERLLEALQDAGRPGGEAKKDRILQALLQMYQSPNSLYLNFYGPPGTIPTISYYRALGIPEVPGVQTQALDFHGKAVFVGLAEPLQPEYARKDGFYTVFSDPSGLDISGVEIAATAFANLLEARPIRQPGLFAHLATLLLWGLLLGALCCLLPLWIAAASVIGLSVLYGLAAQQQFNAASLWSPLVTPIFLQAPLAFFGTVFWNYFDIHQERQNIRKAFEHYLPDRVVDQLARNLVDIQTDRQVVYGTCLYTDAEQYTALSEILDLKALGNFTNQYYAAIFEPVKQHGGTVSNVVGDSMLAIWVSAHPDAALRTQACLAALDIAMAVQRFNRSSGNLRLPTRIGVHAGQMLLGNIGAIDHYEYCPIGDIVNTAARIEGLNKYLGTRILVSEEVLDQLDGLLVRELGKFILAGKSRPTVIYELICRREESASWQGEFCAAFAGALDAYRNRSWEEAIQGFREALKIQRGDGPSRFYLRLCQSYRKSPPEAMWDGLVCLDKK